MNASQVFIVLSAQTFLKSEQIEWLRNVVVKKKNNLTIQLRIQI